MTHPVLRRSPLHCEDIFVDVLSSGKLMFSLPPLMNEFLLNLLLPRFFFSFPCFNFGHLVVRYCLHAVNVLRS